MCNVSVTSGVAVTCGRLGLCVGVIWIDGPHFGSGSPVSLGREVLSSGLASDALFSLS